jgi:hypothetical protein
MSAIATYTLNIVCGGKLKLNIFEDGVVFEHYNGESWNELFDLNDSEIKEMMHFLYFSESIRK